MNQVAEVERASGSFSVPDSNSANVSVDDVPRAILREVAAQTKSLSRALPYPEYAGIVHRIARVKWRCASKSA